MRDLFDKLRILRLLVACAIDDWRTSVWEKDLDAPLCCAGKWNDMCGCRGMTVRDCYLPTPAEPVAEGGDR